MNFCCSTLLMAAQALSASRVSPRPNCTAVTAAWICAAEPTRDTGPYTGVRATRGAGRAATVALGSHPRPPRESPDLELDAGPATGYRLPIGTSESLGLSPAHGRAPANAVAAEAAGLELAQPREPQDPHGVMGPSASPQDSGGREGGPSTNADGKPDPPAC